MPPPETGTLGDTRWGGILPWAGDAPSVILRLSGLFFLVGKYREETRMKAAAILAGALLLVVDGCAATAPRVQTPIPRNAVFVHEEYEPYAGEGTATILGQAFAKTRGGDVKYGAGCTVILNPVTSYSREWWTLRVLAGDNLEAADLRVTAYTHQTAADGEGRFRFEKLKPGEYYAACWITWEVPSSYGAEKQAVCVGKHIRIGEGESVNVILPTVSYYGTKPGTWSRGWIPTGAE